MKPAPREKLPTASGDVLAEQIAKLQRLFPEAVSEGKIDWDKLQATLGDAVTTAPERFSFTWSGKSAAIQLLQTPTHATLIPCPDESVDPATTGNVFIEGDNLEVLKLLFKPYFGKVKLIYIDPPYNTGQDFVYPDDYADPLNLYLKMTGQMDAEGNLLTSNPETSGRYHSSWLSMMYPRLFLARQLLRDDGSILISIDDNEVHHLRMLMNEIFGEENFVACVIWQKVFAPKPAAKTFSTSHDYLVLFARDNEHWDRKLLPRTKAQDERYENPDDDPRGVWASDNLLRNEHRDNSVYTITSPSGKTWTPKQGTSWRHPEDEMKRLIADNQISFGKDSNGMPRRKKFLTDVQQGLVPETLWLHSMVGHTQDAKREIIDLFGYDVFPTPKPTSLIRQAALITTGENDIVLDFFAGSCTTAQAVLELNREDGGNRKFIMVQLPEPTGNKDYSTIAEIGKERIRRVLAKLKIEAAESLKDETAAKPDLGFKVFKLAAPHIQPWSAGDADREPDKYAAKLAMYNDPLMPGWTAENVLWEIALREGFGLNTRFEEKKLKKGNTIWLATDPDKDPPQTLIVCLDDKIAVDFSKHVELTPEQIVVARDVALDDTAAANLALQCRLKTI